MAYKIKKVKATTNNVTQAIINHLESHGHYAGRINTTGIYDPVSQVWRKVPEREKGKFDIYACLFPSGISLWIDIKTQNDKPSKYQLEFKNRIESSGGIAIFIKTYNEYLLWYKKNMKS